MLPDTLQRSGRYSPISPKSPSPPPQLGLQRGLWRGCPSDPLSRSWTILGPARDAFLAAGEQVGGSQAAIKPLSLTNSAPSSNSPNQLPWKRNFCICIKSMTPERDLPTGDGAADRAPFAGGSGLRGYPACPPSPFIRPHCMNMKSARDTKTLCWSRKKKSGRDILCPSSTVLTTIPSGANGTSA